MPLWPFIMLGAIFLAVLIFPPLISAYLDHLREQGRVRGRERRRSADVRYPLDPAAGAAPVQQDPGEAAHPLPPEEIVDPGEPAGEGAGRDPVGGYSAPGGSRDGDDAASDSSNRRDESRRRS